MCMLNPQFLATEDNPMRVGLKPYSREYHQILSLLIRHEKYDFQLVQELIILNHQILSKALK